MKAAFVRFFLSAMLLIALASAASATVGYVNPPQFTPQRTLFWDFSQSDWTTPATMVGPTWDQGDWTCDDISHSSTLQWYEGPNGWTGHQGLIGCDNTNGTGTVNGSLAIHINNFPPQNPLKLVWYEVVVKQWGEGLYSEASFGLPQGYTADKVILNSTELPEGGMVANDGWEIRPNPTWETFTWNFSVPAGGGVLVDRFYISTACVPEPSSLMALGAGLMGLGGFLVRRKRG